MSRLHIEFAREILFGGYTFQGKNLVRYETLVARGFPEKEKVVFKNSGGIESMSGEAGVQIGLVTGPQYEPLFDLPLFYRLTALRVRLFENSSWALNETGDVGDLELLIPIYWGFHLEGGVAAIRATSWFDSSWPLTFGLAQQWSGKSIDGKERQSPDFLSGDFRTQYHMIHSGLVLYDSVKSRAGDVLCQPKQFPGDEDVVYGDAQEGPFDSCTNSFLSSYDEGEAVTVFPVRNFYAGIFGFLENEEGLSLSYDVGYWNGFSELHRKGVSVHLEIAGNLFRAFSPFLSFTGNFIVSNKKDVLAVIPQEGDFYSWVLGFRLYFYPESGRENAVE